MSILIQTYPTRKVMTRQKKLMVANGWSSLHTDFINNNERDGFKVTFVNGSDDPDNSDQEKENRLRFRLKQLLVESIEKDTITWEEYKMLLRLERDLELKQSTIDKLIILKQGGLSGIIQRIKNLFGL